MNPESLEPFVDADQAAKFLFLTRRHVLELARAGKLPGHPIGDGARRVWRFRLSELAAAVSARISSELAGAEKAVSFGIGQSRSCGELRSPRGPFSTGTVTRHRGKGYAVQAERG